MGVNEVVQYLSDLVKIDTTNAPGNETKAAAYVKTVLDAAGIETNLYESAPGRGNAVARLKGDGSKKPLMLLSHLDVVNAQPEQWSMPPFSGEVVNGFVWGRGSLDCKNLTALEMEIMLRLKRDGVQLKRDVILAATADEEAGGNMGVGWLCNNTNEMDAEYCINEGGGSGLPLGDKMFYTCNVAEKAGTRLKLTGKGEPGHASVWKSETAIARLCEAILILARNPLPLHQTTATRKMAEAIAQGAGLPVSFVTGLFDESQSWKLIQGMCGEKKFQALSMNSMLSNTANTTIVNAG